MVNDNQELFLQKKFVTKVSFKFSNQNYFLSPSFRSPECKIWIRRKHTNFDQIEIEAKGTPLSNCRDEKEISEQIHHSDFKSHKIQFYEIKVNHSQMDRAW